jgi:2-haloacid dehalogenase
MSEIKAVIFDLGNVLIDWNPNYVFDNYFESKDKQEYFFKNICTSSWNEEQDAGRLIEEATNELVKKFPEWEKAIRDYYGRWTEMLKGPIDESVEIFRELKKNAQLKFYALTNWSAETFPYALEKYEFLHWFDGRVVSGEEKMRKPFPQFYKLLLARYQLNANEVLFIDDNLRNVAAAEELGIRSIHFQSPDQLKESLSALGLLKDN